jgi:argininosuccinate synthase
MADSFFSHFAHQCNRQSFTAICSMHSPALELCKFRNGVGICDIVENRLVGMKSRGVYENPAGSILFYAHSELERLCLDRATLHFKEVAAVKYSELVYDGMWFAPLREALQAFADETSKTVTGKVSLRLYKGNILSNGAESPYSLYNEEFVTFGEDEVYNQADAEGFINLFGPPHIISLIFHSFPSSAHEW